MREKRPALRKRASDIEWVGARERERAGDRQEVNSHGIIAVLPLSSLAARIPVVLWKMCERKKFFLAVVVVVPELFPFIELSSEDRIILCGLTATAPTINI